MKLGELFFNLGFKADTMKLKDFGRAVADLNMSSVLAATGFGAVYEGAKKLIQIAENIAQGTNKYTRETEKSSDAFQRWVGLAKVAGVDGKIMEQTLRDIAEAHQDLLMGKAPKNAQFWNFLHLTPDIMSGKDPGEVVFKMFERLKGYSTEQQASILRNLGMSIELLDIEKQFPDLRKAYNEQTILSGKELAEVNNSMKLAAQLSADMEKIWGHIGVTLLPIADGFVHIAQSLDDNILKSKQWKAYLEGVAFVMSSIAHPIKSAMLLADANGSKDDWKFKPMFRFPWQKFNLDGSIAPSGKDLSRASDVVGSDLQPKVHVVQHNQITVQGSHDPEAVAKEVDKQIGRHIDHAVASGSPGGF